ncbi:MAG: hypothetical protein D6705_06275 [Deltaproteobacteria bacterium]|nr:MAG: hypothetical protein D6705_06275 [Deltaproteobacteria bacterium]
MQQRPGRGRSSMQESNGPCVVQGPLLPRAMLSSYISDVSASRARCAWALLLAGAGGCGHAAAAGPPSEAEVPRSRIVRIAPRCPQTKVCVVGHVVLAESADPVPGAAVFVAGRGRDGRPIRFVTRTDDEGVFTVTDPPEGVYRVAIYKDARYVEAKGLELGAAGTTVLPVRLGRR